MLKAFRKILFLLLTIYWKFANSLYFKLNGVKFNGLKCQGIPYLNINGIFEIGNNFKLNSTISSNPIGRNFRSQFFVGKKGVLKIGNNFGGSSIAIVCKKSIEIGDNVLIGGGTVIYDNDFHSIKHKDRLNRSDDIANIVSKKITIGNNVFIGAHTIILKGVEIGDNAVIGSGSVVSKNVPSNEVWAGNPAKRIKELHKNL